MDLRTLIKESIDQLPSWCKAEYGSHNWRPAYGDPDLTFLVQGHRIKKGEQMLPYYVCEHCYAISNNFPTVGYIKRVR